MSKIITSLFKKRDIRKKEATIKRIYEKSKAGPTWQCGPEMCMTPEI